MGAFFGVFGACVLVAIAFTDGARGRVVNLVCGLAFLGVAAVFAAIGRRSRDDS